MLNIKTFNDVAGDHVEIDRRQVCEAYVDNTKDPSTIVLVPEGRGVTRLGIGARGEIEAWLGLKLPTLTVTGGMLTGHLVGLANVAAARKAEARP